MWTKDRSPRQWAVLRLGLRDRGRSLMKLNRRIHTHSDDVGVWDMECHSETHLMELSQQRWVINLMDPTRLFHSRWSQPRSHMAYGDGENLRKILHIYELLLFHGDWLKSMKYLPPKPATINSNSIPGRSHNGPDFWGIFFCVRHFGWWDTANGEWKLRLSVLWWVVVQSVRCITGDDGGSGGFATFFLCSLSNRCLESTWNIPLPFFQPAVFCSRFWRWYCLFDWLIGIYMIRPIRRGILLVVISANGKPSPCKLPS